MNKDYVTGPLTLEDGKMIFNKDGEEVATVFLMPHTVAFTSMPLVREATGLLFCAAPELVEALIDQAKDTTRKETWSDPALSLLPSSAKDRAYVDSVVNTEWQDYLTESARAALTKAGIIKSEDQ